MDRPLSFLDHHLKCGDSLVGAEVGNLGWPPPILTKKQAQRQQAQREAGQMDLFSQRLTEQLPPMMLSILDITNRESDSYESVQEKEAADRTVRQLKAPFEAIADLWTSTYFGNGFTPAEYAEALEQIRYPTRLLAQPAVQHALAISRADWREMLKLWHVAVVAEEDGPQKGSPSQGIGDEAQHLAQGRSDVVHDLLALLAEEMIAMNKERQAATADFWLDVEGVTDGATFAALRNKGRWESSLAKETALAPFVDRESRSTRTLEESLGWSEAAFKGFVKQLAGPVGNLSGLVGCYRKYEGRYRALAARLAATDRLIDGVVYGLYGLTGEEVKVVEGSAKK